MSLPVDDPFALLGLPQRLDLSPQQIQQAHMRAIAQAHPDAARHTSEDDVSGEDDAMVRSARLNHARSIVAHPERRAIALQEAEELAAAQMADVDAGHAAE